MKPKSTTPKSIVRRGQSKDKLAAPAPYRNDVRRKWLIGILHAYGQSNQAIANMIEMDGSTFNLLTTGRRYITDLSVYRIVRKLGVPPPTGMPPPPPVIAKQQNEQTIAELNQRIAVLTKQMAALKSRLQPVKAK